MTIKVGSKVTYNGPLGYFVGRKGEVKSVGDLFAEVKWDGTGTSCEPKLALNEEREPKFNVGDKTRHVEVAEAGIGIVDYVKEYNGEIYCGVQYANNFGHCEDSEDFLVLVPPVKQHIVAINDIHGKPQPSPRPFIHDDQESADTEARRLANCNPGKTFTVFVAVSESSAPLPPPPPKPVPATTVAL